MQNERKNQELEDQTNLDQIQTQVAADDVDDYYFDDEYYNYDDAYYYNDEYYHDDDKEVPADDIDDYYYDDRYYNYDLVHYYGGDNNDQDDFSLDILILSFGDFMINFFVIYGDDISTALYKIRVTVSEWISFSPKFPW